MALAIFWSRRSINGGASWVGDGPEEIRPGATDKEIKIGQTMPYSGSTSAYGTLGVPTNTTIQNYLNAKKVA